MGFFLKYQKGFSEEWSEKEMEGSDGTCEGTDDTTTFVQIEEAKYAIHKLSFVTSIITPRHYNTQFNNHQAPKIRR